MLQLPYSSEDQPVVTRWLLDLSNKQWEVSSAMEGKSLEINTEIWMLL